MQSIMQLNCRPLQVIRARGVVDGHSFSDLVLPSLTVTYPQHPLSILDLMYYIRLDFKLKIKTIMKISTKNLVSYKFLVLNPKKVSSYSDH
jgi:hypothetical protein